MTVICLSGNSCGLIVKKIRDSERSESKTDSTKVSGVSTDPVSSENSKDIAAASSEALRARKYQYLEDISNKARENKERLLGGYWKLFQVYGGITTPNFGQNAAPSEWESHFARLDEWKRAMPDSITARVAMASSWVTYAWEVRGTDLANTVSDENVRIFRERIDKAKDELEKSKSLEKKCPEWYSTMLSVAQAEGWSHAKYDEVFEEGFNLEPTYYTLVDAKTVNLMPQWSGKAGDLARFVDDTSTRIDGDEGDIMYFEITSMLQPNYGGNIFRDTGLNWQRAKLGYAALKKHYGVDRRRKNMFMYLALHAGDVQASDGAEMEVGDDWDEGVWKSKKTFDNIRFGIQMMRKAKAFSATPTPRS